MCSHACFDNRRTLQGGRQLDPLDVDKPHKKEQTESFHQKQLTASKSRGNHQELSAEALLLVDATHRIRQPQDIDHLELIAEQWSVRNPKESAQAP